MLKTKEKEFESYEEGKEIKHKFFLDDDTRQVLTMHENEIHILEKDEALFVPNKIMSICKSDYCTAGEMEKWISTKQGCPFGEVFSAARIDEESYAYSVTTEINKLRRSIRNTRLWTGELFGMAALTS